jgi:transketolase
MRSLPGMRVWSPADDKVAAALVSQCLKEDGPAYVRLHRTTGAPVYDGAIPALDEGMAVLRAGGRVAIAATGPMVRRALEVREVLAERGLESTVIDVFRLKPFPAARFSEAVQGCERVVTIEEHFASGGLGSAVLEAMSELGVGKPVRRFGLPDRFCYECGDRDFLHAVSGLDTATLAARMLE